MTSLGMCALFYSVSLTNTDETSALSVDTKKLDGIDKPFKKVRSVSTSPHLYTYMSNPKEAIQRYVFGFHAKTKRSLAEEAESGDEISVNSWIRDGCDPNEIDLYGYTPLINASALGRLKAVKQLVQSGADVNKSGPFGFSALHAAAQGGHREVVAYLLRNGADINAQNAEKDTPMHLALRAQRIEVVYQLLRSGGNSRIEGFNKKNCIECAKECGLHDLAKTLNNYSVFNANHPSADDFKNSISVIN